MNEIKRNMISKAMELYKEIHPCSTRSELGECFTTEGNMIMFWFNTSDNSTHILTHSLQ